jgi:hypothetical protein
LSALQVEAETRRRGQKLSLSGKLPAVAAGGRRQELETPAAGSVGEVEDAGYLIFADLAASSHMQAYEAVAAGRLVVAAVHVAAADEGGIDQAAAVGRKQ